MSNASLELNKRLLLWELATFALSSLCVIDSELAQSRFLEQTPQQLVSRQLLTGLRKHPVFQLMQPLVQELTFRLMDLRVQAFVHTYLRTTSLLVYKSPRLELPLMRLCVQELLEIP